jgi:hypothetical protein
MLMLSTSGVWVPQLIESFAKSNHSNFSILQNPKHIRETINIDKSPFNSSQPSTVLHIAQETENIEEEVDEIEIEANCSHDVLIRGEALVDEIRVIDDISTEQQSAPNGVNEIES